MKIAISTEGGNVSAHFGRCPEFTLLEIENGQLVRRSILPNPDHQLGYLPGYLKQQGVEVVVAGGGGQRAQMLFAEQGIQFILGVSGAIDEIVGKLCRGELEGGESLCTGGSHDHDQCDHAA